MQTSSQQVSQGSVWRGFELGLGDPVRILSIELRGFIRPSELQRTSAFERSKSQRAELPNRGLSSYPRLEKKFGGHISSGHPREDPRQFRTLARTTSWQQKLCRVKPQHIPGQSNSVEGQSCEGESSAFQSRQTGPDFCQDHPARSEHSRSTQPTPQRDCFWLSQQNHESGSVDQFRNPEYGPAFRVHPPQSQRNRSQASATSMLTIEILLVECLGDVRSTFSSQVVY